MSISSHREMEIFSAALEIADLTQRRIFLDQACAGDEELRASVGDLLAALGDAEQFFPDATSLLPLTDYVAGAAAPFGEDGDPIFEEKPGATFGQYKVIKKIGEGGCGMVYLAEQEQPVRRRLALKVIKLGMDTKSVIARFEAERQALAMMDHPNIACVFDAGATERGRPYFVMELVNGVKITGHCDEHRLGLEQRLELFIQVCQAIEHAHQKGIIHRDIKPSNILVSIHDGAPAPKVIDFGIAKATEEPLTDKTLYTAYAQLIGTPAYMSPEQIELGGAELDPRSDLYSLGVLLYEMLTGRTPFDSKELIESGVDGMRRTLLEREPRTPSARLHSLSGEELARTAMYRRVGAPELVSQLRGDLDWIVMKALEKDRSRRYKTAHDLEMDIRRYLKSEPVLARPPTRWYPLKKWVSRNRMACAFGAAIAVVLLLGTLTSTWLYLQERAAERRAVAAQQEVDSRRDEEIAGRVAQAEGLVARNDFAAAAKLLDGITLENPSTDAAAMLRKLGDWDAENGRWPQAAARFKQLVRVDREDALDDVMLDHLRLGPALVSSGGIKEYERFRQEMLARYDGSLSADADLIIKFCLLLPANRQVVENLRPQAEYSEQKLMESLASAKRDSDEAWAPLALGLFEYRHGNDAKAAEWCRRCLAFPEYDAARSAAAEAILAMSCWQMKQKEDALVALKQAQEMIAGKFRPGVGVKIGPKSNWFDWEFAGILIREGGERFTKEDPSLAKLSRFEPAVERAALLRAQGEGYAVRQEWRKAADCFEALLKINQRDDWSVASQDFLACGALLAELRDDKGFERVGKEAIARFSGTEHRLAAERIIRGCLLRPFDPDLLAPMAARVVRPFARDEEALAQDRSYNAWHAVNMSFLAGRQRVADFVKAADWARRAIESGDDLPFPAAIGHSGLAMSLFQLKQDDAARPELQQAKELVETGLKKGLDQSNWCDWLCGHVLLSEATGLLSIRDPRKAPETR